MPFTKQSDGTYRSPSGRKFTSKQVKMYYATNGFKKTKKAKIVVNNKMKDTLGSTSFDNNNKPTGKIEINVKGHKGDKKELASTIKHELMHVKHPKMTEKEVYKRTAKTKIPPKEQKKLISRLSSASDRRVDSMKRKYKLDGKPGDMISKVNESKINSNKQVSKQRTAIMGLV